MSTGTLSTEDVRALRMASLLLGPRGAGGAAPATPRDVVTWFGAMQAQDLASGEWSFGVRLPGSTQADIQRATEDRHILRTWPMRGAVHFVPPEDAAWMLEVTGVRALAGAELRRQQLGLTETIVNQAAEVLAAALAGGRQLTRAQCVAVLKEAGLHTTGQHGYHLLWYASQIGVTCIGPQVGKEQTFVLLDEWVPTPSRPSRDEALGILALRYFRSHGPTTHRDFAGWTGLTLADTRKAVALAGVALVTVDVSGVAHVMAAALRDQASEVLGPMVSARSNPRDMVLLPGFDEYLLGFKDRSLMLSAEFSNRIVPGNNGIFLPTMVVDGRVVGTWKREVKSSRAKGVRVQLTAVPFTSLTKQQHTAFVEAGGGYAAFLGLEPEFPA